MPRVPRIVSRISAGVALIGLAACSSDGGTGHLVGAPSGSAVANVAVSPSSATLEVGRTLQLTATLFGGNGQELSGDVSWTSSTSSIASVTNSGLVTAVAEGAATITGSAGGQSGRAVVTVVDSSPRSP